MKDEISFNEIVPLRDGLQANVREAAEFKEHRSWDLTTAFCSSFKRSELCLTDNKAEENLRPGLTASLIKLLNVNSVLQKT
ncbi:unnamed protein product [Angiostrongylus costaricensis]|uniref:Uncharacterized protein n=1 Tax=Angiostrongylus costaricensis TaxID=334426 RepID=A0A0R3Q2T0_ANGCS|nr:unnamed protein product [Angiostrongylus costaricensis]